MKATSPGELPALSAIGVSDTHPAMEAILIEGYRRMSAAEKLERVRAMSNAVRQLALGDIRRRHPDAKAREQALRLASRFLDASLMRAAFDWDPGLQGF